jgi:hypothetical protein
MCIYQLKNIFLEKNKLLDLWKLFQNMKLDLVMVLENLLEVQFGIHYQCTQCYKYICQWMNTFLEKNKLLDLLMISQNKLLVLVMVLEKVLGKMLEVLFGIEFQYNLQCNYIYQLQCKIPFLNKLWSLWKLFQNMSLFGIDFLCNQCCMCIYQWKNKFLSQSKH